MGGTGPQGPAGQAGSTGAKGADGQGFTATAPGLTLELLDAKIGSTGTATVTFRLTDGHGVGLDRAGQHTEGAVSVSFILAALDQTDDGQPLQYTAFTTRTVSSTITQRSETQAATDSGGRFDALGSGSYRYVFAKKAQVTAATHTHTVGAYATRAVAGARAVANAVFHFRPDGQPVQVTRELVSAQACNQCHGDLSAHGGARKSLELCILCHSAQSVDPDTGNTVSFPIMIHKIHRGSALHDLPYRLIGFQQTVYDFSTVEFPQPLARCDACHVGKNAELATTRPSAKACTSCHDQISFSNPPPAGHVLHAGGVQATDSNCSVCHPRTGSLAGIVDKHAVGTIDPARPKLALDLMRIRKTAPGQAPVVRIKVTVDGQARNILTTPLPSLRATIAGPNTDYASYWQATIQGTGAQGTLTAVDAAQGVFDYAFPAKAGIPAGAVGSYTIGLEGYVSPPGGGTTRFAAKNPLLSFAVTGTSTVVRRSVVAADKCDSCHYELSAHGGLRRTPAYCALCHNPNHVNGTRAARVEGSSGVPVESVDLRVMIHKIHAGTKLSRSYVLGAVPVPTRQNPAGTQIDFGATRFPGEIGRCSTCHLPGTELLPLGDHLLPSLTQIRACSEPPARDTNSFCDAPGWVATATVATPPASAVCTSCHDRTAVAAHAELMTTATGVESCATCHAPGSAFDPARSHLPPL